MLRIERDIIVERKSGVHRTKVAPRVRDLARALLMFVRVTAKQQVLLAPASRIRVVDPALQNVALSVIYKPCMT